MPDVGLGIRSAAVHMVDKRTCLREVSALGGRWVVKYCWGLWKKPQEGRQSPGKWLVGEGLTSVVSVFLFVCLSFFGHTCSMRKLPGQGLNHSSDNTRYLTRCTSRDLQTSVTAHPHHGIKI